PYLERWLKKRFHPTSLWSELKRFAPAWMEKFPQVPHLIFNGMQQMQNLGQIAPQLQEISDQLRDDKRRRTHRQRKHCVALLAFGGALAVAWPRLSPEVSQWAADLSLTDIPVGSYLLAAIGVVALVFKRD